MKITHTTKSKLAKLDNILGRCGSLLIIMHDYPDPDALASAMVLSYLARNRYRLRTNIVYGGIITRAESRTMVQQLKIKLTHINRIRWRYYDCIAMVDTQPQFGNHSLPDDIKPTIVIDHHPGKNHSKAVFVDIRTEYGASATMLLEYLLAAELEIPVDIATAVAYAIRSETQELGLDASPADIDAYLALYPKANKRKLAKIFKPVLPKQYFALLYSALQKAKVFRHLIHVHLGKVESPEFISQIADWLLRHERTGWSIATGRFKYQLFVSVRCNHPKADAGNMLKQVIGKLGSAGGHPRMAGGQIPFTGHDEQDWQRLQDLIISRFLRKLGIKKEVEWKSMLLRDGSLS